MRKLCLPLLLFISVLHACKKDAKIPLEEVRLEKVQSADSSGNKYYTTFEYDASRRVVKVASAKNNETPQVLCTVSYSGNAATVIYPAVSGPGLYQRSSVTYQLNSSKQPIERFQRDTFILSAPQQQPQFTVLHDSSTYEYNAAGLLTKVRGGVLDSTWYNPGVPQTESARRLYERTYNNSGGMLMGVVTNTTEFSTFRRLATVTLSSSTTDETYAFEYPDHEANRTDFLNAWLFAEIHILYQVEYPLNSAYAHYPQKLSFSRVKKNALNGQTISTDSWSYNIAVSHNRYGFISEYANGTALQMKRELIYNR